MAIFRRRIDWACRHGNTLAAKLAGPGQVHHQLLLIVLCDCVRARGLMHVGEFVIVFVKGAENGERGN